LALASKESAVVIPGLLVAADLACGRLRERLPVHAVTLGVLAAFWFGVRQWVIGPVVQSVGPVENPLSLLPHRERVPGVLGVLGLYARLLFFPLRLSADYSYDAVAAEPPWSSPFVVAGLLVLVASCLGFVVACRRRRVVLALGIALVWLPILPVSNLSVTIGTMCSERFLYLPAVGFGTLVAAGLDGLGEAPRVRALALAAVALLALRTGFRERDWRDEMTLHERTAAGSRSAKAHYQLALLLHRAGRLTEAEAAYRRALAIRAGDFGTLIDLGRLLQDEGRYAEADALARLAEPEQPTTHREWFVSGVQRFARRDWEGARLAFSRALALRPGDPYARLGLTRLALYAEGRAADAVGELEAIVRDAPTLAEAWYDLGECYARLGRDDEARRAFGKAAVLAPNEPGIRARDEALKRGSPDR
jgi:Flp pilus assembly protein TadD